MHFFNKPFDFYRLREIIETEFVSVKEFINQETSTPTFIISATPKTQTLSNAFNTVLEKLADMDLIAFLRPCSPFDLLELGEPSLKKQYYSILLVPKIKEESKPANVKINIILFISTLISVFFAASIYYLFMNADPLHVNTQIHTIFQILPIIAGYGISILAILGLHELGHIAACRKHNTKVSWPYFIPLPLPPLGTMGAIIKQKGLVKNRNELFDVGLYGPLVGFIVTLFVLSIGLYLTMPMTTADYVTFMNILYPFLPRDFIELYVFVQLNSPQLPLMLIFNLLEPIFFPGTPTFHYYAQSIFPVPMPDSLIFFHPLAFASWVGLLLSALNMLPFGQLDGGHVSRAVFGTAGISFNLGGIPRKIELYKIIGLISLGIIFYISPIFGILVFFLSRGISHPGPLDDVTPISRGRKIAFLLFILMIVVSFPMGTLWIFFQ